MNPTLQTWVLSNELHVLVIQWIERLYRNWFPPPSTVDPFFKDLVYALPVQSGELIFFLSFSIFVKV